MKLELFLSYLLVQPFDISSKLFDLIGIIFELILLLMQTLLDLLHFLLILHLKLGIGQIFLSELGVEVLNLRLKRIDLVLAGFVGLVQLILILMV